MKPQIILIRTTNLTARLIHFGMALFSLTRFKIPKKCYNHAEVKFGFWTSGSERDGTKIRRWALYEKTLGHYEKIIYNLDLTPSQIRYGEIYLNKVDGIEYEYSMLWFHLVKIFTGKWKGSKSSRELYCYEHVIRYLIATGRYDLSPYLNPTEFKKWADENLIRE